MRKNLLFIIALVAMCVRVAAQLSPMSITIDGTTKTIEVDGFADDDLWYEVGGLSFDYSFQEPKAELFDIDATLQIAWNQVGLLIFLDITDDQENYFTEGDNTWEQDNSEFFFYFGEDGTWGPDAEVTTVDNDTLFSQIRLQLTDEYETTTDGRFKGTWGAAPTGPADSAKMEAVAVPSASGWSLEAIMPWAMFSKTYEVEVGMKFGFEVCIGDADETLRDNQLSLLNDSGTDDAYENKSYLNTAILGEVIAVYIPSYFVNTVCIYPTLVDNLLNLTGKVTSLTIYNVSGQAVLSVKDDSITTVDVSELQPGIYFVNLNNETTQKIVVR